MNSQDIKNAISGALVVDKPVGMTSHDVVQAIRNGTNLRRAGHTGTLDPRASGVLVILVGLAPQVSTSLLPINVIRPLSALAVPQTPSMAKGWLPPQKTRSM